MVMEVDQIETLMAENRRAIASLEAALREEGIHLSPQMVEAVKSMAFVEYLSIAIPDPEAGKRIDLILTRRLRLMLEEAMGNLEFVKANASRPAPTDSGLIVPGTAEVDAINRGKA